MRILFLALGLGLTAVVTVLAQGTTMGYRVEDPKITRSLAVIDILLKENKTDQALTETDQLYQQFPDNPRIFAKLESIYRDLGNDEKLMELYQKKLVKNPANADFSFKLAQYYLDRNQSDRSIRQLERLLKASNYNYAIITMIFEKCVAWGLNEYAVGMVTETRRQLNRPSLLAFEMATIYDLEGNETATLDEYILFLSIPENEPNYYTRRGYVQQTLQDRIKAKPELMDLLSRKLISDKTSPDLAIFLANLHYELGDFKKAFDLYIQEDQRRNAGGNITFQFANYCLEKQDYLNGIHILQYVETHYQQDFTLKIGQCFENLELPDSSIRYYQKVLTRTPAQPVERIEAAYRLSRIYEEVHHDLPQSLMYMEMIDPNALPDEMASQIQLSRARLMMKTERFDQAAALLGNLIKLPAGPSFSPGDAYFFLGKTMMYRKQYLNATPLFQRVMAQYPKSRYYNDLIRLFSLLQRIEDNLPMLNELVDAEWSYEACRFQEASDRYAAFITHYPQFPEMQKIYMRLIEVLAETGSDILLKQYAAQAIALNPESFESMFISYHLAECHLREKDYASAHKLFQTILRSSNGIALKPKVRKRIEDLRLKGLIQS
ncbi:MAG: tetratricopeptide repeat protein [Candidatus Delongbacteria bacterium]|nr:tetratricopeptide repeat protein [Candidatus Delongbacteria bacterium]